MSDKNQINSLMLLAQEIIANKDNPEVINQIENYALQFGNWYDAYEKSLNEASPLNTKSELEDLLLRHERVSEISENMKALIPDQMAKLKAKGKGILAYTDVLPKKISFTKTTKG